MSEYSTPIAFALGAALGALWSWALQSFEIRHLRETNRQLAKRNLDLESRRHELQMDRLFQEFQRSLTNGGD